MNRQSIMIAVLGVGLAGGVQATDWQAQSRQVARQMAAAETDRWQQQHRNQAREQQRLQREAQADREARLRQHYQQRERTRTREQGLSLSATNVGRSTISPKGTR